MALRTIKCVNEDGYAMTFDEKGFSPFILAKAQGIYDAENTIYTTNNTMIDGAEYQGSVMNARNIVLSLKEKDADLFASNRDSISVLFANGKQIILTVYEDTHERQIECYVENITTTPTPKTRITTVSLICPTPYFYDTFDTRVAILEVQPFFEFSHEFSEDGEEFSYFNDNKLVTITNNRAENNIGLTFKVTASSTVTNPRITKVETQEKIALGTEEKPFELYAEDTLIITTTTGSKNVYLIRDGETIDVNEYLTNDSTFIQLGRYSNTFGCNADEGKDYMLVVISYRYKYQRA